MRWRLEVKASEQQALNNKYYTIINTKIRSQNILEVDASESRSEGFGDLRKDRFPEAMDVRGLVRPVDGRSAGLDGCMFYEVQLSTVLGSGQDSSSVPSHCVFGGEGVLSGSGFDASSSVVCVVL